MSQQTALTADTSPLDEDFKDIEFDERTDLTVAGYIRKVQRKLSAPLNIIAKDIFSIILLYTRCRDLYGGAFEWCINKELMYKMFVSSSKQRFASQQFEIGGVHWELFAYPNGSGARDLGSFKLFLKPRFIPLQYNKITIFAGFYCFETQSGDATIFTFDKNQQKYKFYSRQNGSMLLDDIKYRLSDHLRIKINIKILKIIHVSDDVFYPNSKNKINCNSTQSFSWIISGELMKEMKYAYLRKCFISKIFNKMWCLKIYPSGHSGNKTVRIELQICSFPAHKTNLLIKGTINIRNWTRSLFEHDFDYIHSVKDCGANLLTFKGFKSCDEFIIDIQINVIQPTKLVECKVSELSVNYNDLHQNMIDGLNAIEQRRLNDINSLTKRFDTTIANVFNQITRQIQGIQNSQHIYQQNISQIINVLTQKINDNQQEIKTIYNDNRSQNSNSNSNSNNSNINSNKQMSEYDIIRIWLRDIVKLNQYFELLIKNGYDNVEIVMDMDESDLKQIGIHKIGHRRKIIKYKNIINTISNTTDQNDTSTSESPANMFEIKTNSNNIQSQTMNWRKNNNMTNKCSKCASFNNLDAILCVLCNSNLN